LTPGFGIWDTGSGSGIGKKSGSGSGIWIRGKTWIIFLRAEKPFFWVKILKFFDADPGSRTPDGKNSDAGSGIQDKENLDPESGIWDGKNSDLG
jgi:hypothetical protein